ncbi:hypothetical protein DNFV4_00988 [Nitrospira tepida]|uniref:Fervidolysin-like N-terminal prodomain domain-containing protein n=2 Tax=Nitrospira tepida TaxID=2973512 RepID=A0AA86T2H1_9BACT|nr:hypothetical protein DNFV4_00988 [Nitrospira tepida]
MACLAVPSRSAVQLVTFMMCVSGVCLSASCDATSRDPITMSTSGNSPRSSAPRFVPQEVLVKFKVGISQEQIAFLLKDNHLEMIAEIQKGRLFHVRILDDRSVESTIKQLTSYQEVEYAEPNYLHEMQK